MENNRHYGVIIFITYIAMLAVCVVLNVFADGGVALSTIIVNAAMFLVVGVILVICETKCFAPTASMAGELDEASERIRRDALRGGGLLWEKYRADKEGLFKDPVLKEQYADYVFELDRMEQSDTAYYKVNIEDYINYELVDDVIHAGMLSQVAGAMTGLGILGTFIGLVIGLGGFSTGSTSEIANSIKPLMDGIKVAFHTSIYGMVFSLVFNYTYKRRVLDAEKSVKEFLGVFKKYVLPDTENDGINRLIELTQEQTRAIRELPDAGAAHFAEALAEKLTPQFDRFDRTIKDFGSVQAKNQMDALGTIVNSFISEMNRSLGDTFTTLSESVYRMTAAQAENEKGIREMLTSTSGAIDRLTKMQELSEKLIETLGSYSKESEKLQEAAAAEIKTLKEMAATDRELIDKQQKYLLSLRDQSALISESARALDERIEAQAQLLDRLYRTIDYSYEGIETGFDRASRAVEDLSLNISKLEKNRKKGLFK